MFCGLNDLSFLLRFISTAMRRGSRADPFQAEAFVDLLSVGSKGAVSDVCLTGSVQKG